MPNERLPHAQLYVIPDDEHHFMPIETTMEHTPTAQREVVLLKGRDTSPIWALFDLLPHTSRDR